jgi:hypothetical protein
MVPDSASVQFEMFFNVRDRISGVSGYKFENFIPILFFAVLSYFSEQQRQELVDS